MPDDKPRNMESREILEGFETLQKLLAAVCAIGELRHGFFWEDDRLTAESLTDAAVAAGSVALPLCTILKEEAEARLCMPAMADR